MRDTGVVADEGQCCNKWKSLKRSYKEVRDHNNKSGNDRKTHPFQKELDEVWLAKPNITPVAIASSSTGNHEEPPEPIEPTSKKRKGEHLDKDGGKTKRHSGVSEVVNFLHGYAEKQEKRYTEETSRLQKMHDDKMGMFKNLMDALKRECLTCT